MSHSSFERGCVWRYSDHSHQYRLLEGSVTETGDVGWKHPLMLCPWPKGCVSWGSPSSSLLHNFWKWCLSVVSAQQMSTSLKKSYRPLGENGRFGKQAGYNIVELGILGRMCHPKKDAWACANHSCDPEMDYGQIGMPRGAVKSTECCLCHWNFCHLRH